MQFLTQANAWESWDQRDWSGQGGKRKIRKGEERGEREGTEECFRGNGYYCGEQEDLSIQ